MLPEKEFVRISKKNLREKIENQNLSALALERKAGLGRNSIHNLLTGKSKRPQKRKLQALCDILKCRPEEITVYEYDREVIEYFLAHDIVNRNLLSSCVVELNSQLDALQTEVTFQEFFSSVHDIYEYSIENGLGDKTDEKFVRWVLKRVLEDN